jgi:hypothetical protein
MASNLGTLVFFFDLKIRLACDEQRSQMGLGNIYIYVIALRIFYFATLLRYILWRLDDIFLFLRAIGHC